MLEGRIATKIRWGHQMRDKMVLAVDVLSKTGRR
jgi:hypothetical protein